KKKRVGLHYSPFEALPQSTTPYTQVLTMSQPPKFLFQGSNSGSRVSAQWEFYHVISGRGIVRHKDGATPIEPGDAFIFKPNEPHQIINNGTDDLIFYLVADNPINESWYYPDSKKWSVPIPERRYLRSDALDYYDGEE
ncbi:MAG TPA: cupin domain-containing protein, partial [Verrucomicrobiae bacterium]|nr:cupin domain-containing protein [Verrucomicrobiae bacterium]